VVIDPGRDLDLGSADQENLAHHPSATSPSPAAAPTAVILPSAPPARGYRAMTHQRQLHRHDPRLTSAGI
jgi:hypothetical protein